MIGQWFSNMYVVKKIGFEDLKSFTMGTCILINTLLSDEQHCLIRCTLSASLEEKTINDLLDKNEVHQQRIVGPPGAGRAVVDGVSERRPDPAPSEPALRSGDGRRAAVRPALHRHPHGCAAPAGPHYRPVCDVLCRAALMRRILPRT